MENETLVLDLLEWIWQSPRPYTEVMDAWRTSCPRLSIWEDAVDSGFLSVRAGIVHITTDGSNFLVSRRPGELKD